MSYIREALFYLVQFFVFLIFACLNLMIMESNTLLQVVFILAVVLYYGLGNYRVENVLLLHKYEVAFENKIIFNFVSKFLWIILAFIMIYLLSHYMFVTVILFLVIEFILAITIKMTMIEFVTLSRYERSNNEA